MNSRLLSFLDPRVLINCLIALKSRNLSCFSCIHATIRSSLQISSCLDYHGGFLWDLLNPANLLLMQLPEVWLCFPPVLEHFHSDPSSYSNKLKLLHFPSRVFHDLCPVCLPLTHTLAMLNSPSEHNSYFLALCAFAAPLLSETSPVSPPSEFIIQLK